MSVLESLLETVSSVEKVAFAGDWHGNLLWAQDFVAKAADEGYRVILHVGDFGLWPGPKGDKYLRRLDQVCKANDVLLLVTPGNHENWRRLAKAWEGEEVPVSFGMERVWFLPRGYRFQLNGVDFLSFGGAASIDRQWRDAGKDWWPEELPTPAHVAKATAGGATTVLILHETPDEAYAVDGVRSMLMHNPQGFPSEALAYSRESRLLVTQVLEATRPKVVVHGHMHLGEAALRSHQDGSPFLVCSMGKEHEPTNFANLNLVELQKYPAHQLSSPLALE